MKVKLTGGGFRAICGIVLTFLAAGIAIFFLFKERYLFAAAMVITVKLMFKLIFEFDAFKESFVAYGAFITFFCVSGTFAYSDSFDIEVQSTKFVNVGKLATMDFAAGECLARLSEDDESKFRTLHDTGFQKCGAELATNPSKGVIEVSKAYYLDPVSGLADTAYNEVVKAPEKADCAAIIAALNTLCPSYLPMGKPGDNSRS